MTDSVTSRREADVVRVDFGGCLLLTDSGEWIDAIVRGKLMGRRKALGNAVVVGDRAGFEIQGERAVVDEVDVRRNAFSRRAAGRHPVEQVVAANLDQVVLVASVAQPPFKAGFADRVLSQSEHAGIPARLVLNKTDLAPEAEGDLHLGDYERAGVPVHRVCAKSGSGIEELRHVCRGRRSLFIGHSGVGKSTLLNAMVPGIGLLEGRVNPKTGRGRHTTTAAWLIRPETGWDLIDTPGVRIFPLWGVDPGNLDQAYVEFRRFLGRCRFSDCRHQAEPGCAIRSAVEAGHIPARRLASYHQLRQELEAERSR